MRQEGFLGLNCQFPRGFYKKILGRTFFKKNLIVGGTFLVKTVWGKKSTRKIPPGVCKGGSNIYCSSVVGNLHHTVSTDFNSNI